MSPLQTNDSRSLVLKRGWLAAGTTSGLLKNQMSLGAVYGHHTP